MRVGSLGVIFIVFLMIFIVAVGFKSLSNTEYNIVSYQNVDDTNWSSTVRTLTMFNLNFAPLAGDLCTGYFLHTCALPVLRASANPKNNIRDLFLGYVLVFISYSVVGIFGYIGFTGYNYSSFYLNEQDTSLKG
jgi:hypothetical protein